MIYSVRETTPTTLDLTLIPLIEAKNYLRINTNESLEDTRLENLIKAARQEVENRINRVILSATWTHRMDSFPISQIQLIKTPVQSVTSVKYYDTDGNQQTLDDGTDYRVDVHTARLAPENGASWPATEANKYSAVEIAYVAGYTVANVPPGLKNGILYKLWESYHGDPMNSLIDASTNFYKNMIF